MRHLLLASTVLTLTAGLSAQSAVATASDYGVNATAGKSTVFRGVAKGTKITRGLLLLAHNGRVASASSLARPSHSLPLGAGVSVVERGRATSASASGSASAGTTTKKGGTTGDRHAVVWSARIKQSTKGVVTVVWTSRTSAAGAKAAGTVSVNGKVLASFTSKDKPTRKSFAVTAGAHGISILVSTSASAAVKGRGSAWYGTSLGAWFKPAGSGGKCTFTKVGRPCNRGGILDGSASHMRTRLTITLKLTGARPRSLGVMLLGSALKRPIKLPGGGCSLAVVGIPVLALTSSSGTASRSFHLPGGRAFSFSSQAGVVWLERGKGLQIGTSNRLDVKCSR